MAKNNKKNTRRSMTSRDRSRIIVCVLLVITICISVLGITGMTLGDEGAKILLPWMPVRKAMKAYTLSLPLGGGTGLDLTLTPVAGTADEDADAEETEEAEEAEESAEPAEETEPAAAQLPEGAADRAVAVMKARLAHSGFEGVKVEKKDESTIHVEYPDEEKGDLIETLLSYTGKIEFRDSADNVVAGNEGITSASANARYGTAQDGAYYYFYSILFNISDDLRNTLKGMSEDETVTMYMDGSSVGVTLFADGQNGLTMYSTAKYDTTYMDQVKLWAAVFASGAIEATVSHDHASEAAVEPASAGLYTVLLIVMWALFALVCIYMILNNKAAGLAAAWTMWVYMLFFFFLMATVVLVQMSAAIWIACILGVLLAACTCLCQLREMDKAAPTSRDASSAVRAGFHASVKNVWILNGAALVLALLLMIFAATRPFGYTLAASVVCSVAACIGFIRWTVPCMVTSFGGQMKNVTKATANK